MEPDADETITALRHQIEKLRAAWLYLIQIENECAADGMPCHSHKCGCALEMQNYIDGR